MSYIDDFFREKPKARALRAPRTHLEGEPDEMRATLFKGQESPLGSSSAMSYGDEDQPSRSKNVRFRLVLGVQAGRGPSK